MHTDIPSPNSKATLNWKDFYLSDEHHTLKVKSNAIIIVHTKKNKDESQLSIKCTPVTVKYKHKVHYSNWNTAGC